MTKHINVRVERDIALAVNNSELNVHDSLKHLSVPELQDLSLKDRLPWHTMALNLNGDLNVGTIIRTSHLLGASSVITVGRTRLDRRSLVGAEKYIKVERLNTMADDINLNVDLVKSILTERKLVPIFCELGGNLLHTVVWEIEIPDILKIGCNPCLVMGNETGGIPQNILDIGADFPGSFIVSIGQKGVIRSFNVAVAHAMIANSMAERMGWL